MVLGMTQNMNKGSKVSLSLNTDDYDNKSWESVMFENVPLAAVTTILTKIQNDILVAEGEALKGIVENINFSNFIVNELDAYVIPESEIVIRGSSSTARLVISAVDTTKTYSIFLNNEVKSIDSDGKFEIPTNSVGTHPLNGYVELISNDGSNVRRSFGTSYTVVEPIATIAPTLMNVLYAGIENEISISVPGIAPNDISASMTNGTLYKKGNKWIAKPINIDQSTVITVSARSGNGKVMHMSGNEFKVRKLPDPTPYISYTDANGKSVMFKGGQISKSTILNSSGVGASIDDGILNIPFAVKNFKTIFFDSMGNAIPEVSDGNRFSERQKEQIRRLPRGSYFYVSGIRAVGPDNIEREIAVMEVRIR
jgi:gliding motility-associated protein GldM